MDNRMNIAGWGVTVAGHGKLLRRLLQCRMRMAKYMLQSSGWKVLWMDMHYGIQDPQDLVAHCYFISLFSYHD